MAENIAKAFFFSLEKRNPQIPYGNLGPKIAARFAGTPWEKEKNHLHGSA